MSPTTIAAIAMLPVVNWLLGPPVSKLYGKYIDLIAIGIGRIEDAYRRWRRPTG